MSAYALGWILGNGTVALLGIGAFLIALYYITKERKP